MGAHIRPAGVVTERGTRPRRPLPLPRALRRALAAQLSLHLAALAAPSGIGAQGAAPARTPIDAVGCNAGNAIPATTPPIAWRGDDVRWGEWPVRLGASGVRARIVVVVFDPRRLALALDLVQQDGEIAPWTLDAAPSDARIALNAGQFADDGPWGWVVHRGREWQPPGNGALAGAVVVDTGGAVHVATARAVGAWRGTAAAREAMQSYPTLLDGGAAPGALCPGGSGVDREHRDARLALGVRPDGHVVIALSRYDAPALPARTPLGPTTPEMAEVMRRLGARDALMLDGGLSAQLLLRERAADGGAVGVVRRWPGLRAVPLALLARQRQFPVAAHHGRREAATR